jgi:hypothetical protein
MKRWLIRTLTRSVLELMATLARASGPATKPATQIIEALGRRVAILRNVQPSHDPSVLGRTWQRAFAARKQVPIVHTDETTAFAEIHTPCPLRGSGDRDACYRMMGYDRAFMERANANFVVLRSQAEPGVLRCAVAIRHKDHPTDDLLPAHLR